MRGEHHLSIHLSFADVIKCQTALMFAESGPEVGMNGVTLGADAELALSGARAAARDAEAERQKHHCNLIYHRRRRHLRNSHTREGWREDSGELRDLKGLQKLRQHYSMMTTNYELGSRWVNVLQNVLRSIKL